MQKRTSLKDIAQKLGVSTTLVSYVLNNQKEGRISKEIAQKIRDTAKKLHYRTNQIAKSLKTNKTHSIGLIVADISNPFFSTIARFIEDEANSHHYTLIIGSSDENSFKSARLIDTFLNRQVDGLIVLAPAESESQILQLQKQDVPFVLVDRYFPGIETNSVCLDNYAAAYKAVQHLIERGRKRIGLITFDTPLMHLEERKRGYQSAIDDNKLPGLGKFVKETSDGDITKAIEKAIGELVFSAKPVDAILFTANTLAVHGLKYINSQNIKVPAALAVISFDETDAFDLFYAPLTYIKQPVKEMAQQATRILLESMEGSKEITHLEIEGELIIRKST